MDGANTLASGGPGISCRTVQVEGHSREQSSQHQAIDLREIDVD